MSPSAQAESPSKHASDAAVPGDERSIDEDGPADSKEVLVRQGGIRDLQTLARFNTAMAKETEGIDLPPATIEAGVRAVLEGKVAAAYHVVEVQGEVVGALMVTYEWSDWRASNVWWIQSVYVDPAHRKAGHFKRLYAHVRGAAQRQGAAGLRLYADNANVNAHAAYERLGMTSHYKVFEDMFTHY